MVLVPIAPAAALGHAVSTARNHTVFSTTPSVGHGGVGLLQVLNYACSGGFLGGSSCSLEKLHIVLLCGFLCISIAFVVCMWNFTHVYEDPHGGPLCPSLVVGQPGLGVTIKVDLASTQAMDVVRQGSDSVLCKVEVIWAEPKVAEGPAGVVLTLSLQTPHGVPLAAVAVRNERHDEDGIMICRPGSFVFGFMDVPADPRKGSRLFYRTGASMLNLRPDLNDPSRLAVDSFLGAEVGTVRWEDNVMVGEMVAELDAGLFVCSVLGRHIRLLALAGQLRRPPVASAGLPGPEVPSPGRSAKPVVSQPRGCCMCASPVVDEHEPSDAQKAA